MKQLYFILSVFFGLNYGFGQVGINTNTPDTSSILDIVSSSKGVLFPRMTQTQINAISNPAYSLLVYNTTLNCIQKNISTVLAVGDFVCLDIKRQGLQYYVFDIANTISPNIDNPKTLGVPNMTGRLSTNLDTTTLNTIANY